MGLDQNLACLAQPLDKRFMFDASMGGMHFPSIAVEHLASVARELQAELEGGVGRGTVATRDIWDQIKNKSDDQLQGNREELAVSDLAGHGLYIRDAQEKTLSRCLDQMALLDKFEDNVVWTDTFRKKTYLHWQMYSSTNPLASWMRGLWAEYRCRGPRNEFWKGKAVDTLYESLPIDQACENALPNQRRKLIFH